METEARFPSRPSGGSRRRNRSASERPGSDDAQSGSARLRELELLTERLRVVGEAQVHGMARMSHAMRTPLNAILGFSQLLISRTVTDPARAEEASRLRLIESAGRQLLALIDEAMDLARLDRQARALVLEPVPLDRLLVEILAAVGRHRTDTPVDLLVSTPGPAALADAARLTEILIQMLGHALTRSAPGSRVGVEVGVDPDGHSPWIRISDAGPALSPDELERMFEPFCHITAPATAVPPPNWPLLQRLANWMNARITVESRSDGATLALHLSAPGLPSPHEDRPAPQP